MYLHINVLKPPEIREHKGFRGVVVFRELWFICFSPFKILTLSIVPIADKDRAK